MDTLHLAIIVRWRNGVPTATPCWAATAASAVDQCTVMSTAYEAAMGTRGLHGYDCMAYALDVPDGEASVAGAIKVWEVWEQHLVLADLIEPDHRVSHWHPSVAMWSEVHRPNVGTTVSTDDGARWH